MFGQMVVTYSNGMASSTFRGETGSFRYRVVQRGSDFVVIRSDAPMERAAIFDFDSWMVRERIGSLRHLVRKSDLIELTRDENAA